MRRPTPTARFSPRRQSLVKPTQNLRRCPDEAFAPVRATRRSGSQNRPLRGLGDAALVPGGHHRRAHGLPTIGRHVRRVPSRHGSGERRWRVRPAQHHVDQRSWPHRAGPGAVHPPARRRGRLGGRRHHRVVGGRSRVRCHAQRVEHRPGGRCAVGARGHRHRHHRSTGGHVGARPDRARPGRCGVARGGRGGQVPGAVLSRWPRGGRHGLHGGARSRERGTGVARCRQGARAP